VGYGNPLRGDDAAGQRVATEVEIWALPGVRVIATQQLTPELAAVLAEAQHVIFVDACQIDNCRTVKPHESSISIENLEPASTATSSASGHTSDPGALLALCMAIYGRAPRAWLMTIPACQFDLGADLSPCAAAGIVSALAWIRDALKNNMEIRD
jgi:hydrogenase maturation protease